MGKPNKNQKESEDTPQKEKKITQQVEEPSKIQKISKILKYSLPIFIAYILLQDEINDYFSVWTGSSGQYKVVTAEKKNLEKYKPFHQDVGVFAYPKETTQDSDFSNQKDTTELIHLLHSWSNVTFEKHHFDTSYSYKRYHLGIKNDYEYCSKSDVLKLQEPGIVMDNYYFYNDFERKHLVRQITRAFGVDLTPFALSSMSKAKHNSRSYDLDPKISNLNSKISRVHHFHPFTTCLFCLFQSSNHVPGKWAITGKDLVVNHLRNYEVAKFRDPQVCKDSITFMPKSYRLYNEQECKDFFSYLKSDEYKSIIQRDGLGFIMKAGRDVHRGEGIEILTPDLQEKYISDYEDGKRCGEKKKTVQAQRYIANPMLYKGNKIEIRIYFLVASTNPLIIYSQDHAHLRMCSVPFDKYSLKKEVHVCNVALAKKGRGADQYVVDFSLEGLRDYLLEEKVISNQNWVEEEILPQVHRAVTHLNRLGRHKFLVDSRVNENFALDFLLDDQSKIWFMENNPNPQIMRTSDGRVKRHYNMFGDMFEIQFKYLRARFQRIQGLAKRMIKNLKSVRENPEQWKEEFLKLNRNYLHDQEFQIRSTNSYTKVYDESLEGDAKFMGKLPTECEILE